jgi:hypothetical protein
MLDAGGDAMLGVADNYYKCLPLHYAAGYLKNADSPAVVELLLARGPPGSATSTGFQGLTPLAMAEQYNKSPVVAKIAALLRAAMRWRHGAPHAGRGGQGVVPSPPWRPRPTDPLRESLCGVCLADRDLNPARAPLTLGPCGAQDPRGPGPSRPRTPETLGPPRPRTLEAAGRSGTSGALH